MSETVKIYDIEASKELTPTDFAYKMYKEGQPIVPSDIEDLAKGLDGEWYLLDECGSYVHIDSTKFEVLLPEKLKV